MSALIEAKDLADILPRVKMLDATYGIPGFPGSAQMNMQRARIGDAQFFNIDAITDVKSPYPHTLPSPDEFAAAVGALGIGNDDDVVIYDQNGISFAASRAWWMFRAMGHTRVRVLNGGLPAWLMAGLPTQSGPLPAPAPKKFTASFQPDLYRSFEDVEDSSETVVDARAPARFGAMVHNGDGDTVPAHIPNSRNQSFSDLLDEHGRMKPANDVKALLAPHISGKKIVTSCGSGVTACVLALGFHEAGITDAAVYDGSWTEWADKNALR